jgi:two-component system cell cycle sensor histidine kinase/response regulator CckA
MDNPEHLRPETRDQRVLLVADDEVMIRDLAQSALEEAGYFVLTAHDGEEALTISRTFPGDIHLVLSDVNMPKMDGLKLREYMVAERPETAVLLMSGRIAGDVGIPFLPKPFTPPVLVDTVHNLLRNLTTGR